MTPQHLRLEAPDGSVTSEYHLCHGIVEVRRPPESTWQQLTAQQLNDHVMRSSIVSQWLQARIGWRRLLRMCVAEDSHERTATRAEEHPDMQAV